LENQPRELLYYVTLNDRVPFREWYSGLKSMDSKVSVQSRLARLRRGLLGDCKPVGRGVLELRIFMGPGYRVYFGQQGDSLILLLCGGDKNSQSKDIRLAHAYWDDYLRRIAV
jgi:putative addiction module killer protein